MPPIPWASWRGCIAWPKIESRKATRPSRRRRRPRPPSSTPAIPKTGPSGASSCPHCLGALQALYDRLGVRFDVQLGESFYDPMLGRGRGRLARQGARRRERGSDRRLRRTDRGTVHRPQARWRLQLRHLRPRDDQVPRRDLAPRPDSLRGRPSPGGPFQAAFRGGSQWGYDSVDLEHVAFGTILGSDRRPFKTREGDVVGLESLLDESTAEALKVVEENSPELDPAEQRAGGRGRGAGCHQVRRPVAKPDRATTSSTGRR